PADRTVLHDGGEGRRGERRGTRGAERTGRGGRAGTAPADPRPGERHRAGPRPPRLLAHRPPPHRPRPRPALPDPGLRGPSGAVAQAPAAGGVVADGPRPLPPPAPCRPGGPAVRGPGWAPAARRGGGP